MDREPPGRGGTIGANMVAKAAPDGYTILVYGATSAHALSSCPMTRWNDFVPVMPLGQQPLVVERAGQGRKTLGDLITTGKAKPRCAELLTAGVGSACISAPSGCVPARAYGAAHSLQGRRRGGDRRIRAAPTSAYSLRRRPCRRSATAGSWRSGARAQAISLLPDVPTTIEAGAGGSVISVYTGMYPPVKTSREIVEKLQQNRESGASRRHIVAPATPGRADAAQPMSSCKIHPRRYRRQRCAGEGRQDPDAVSHSAWAKRLIRLKNQRLPIFSHCTINLQVFALDAANVGNTP